MAWNGRRTVFDIYRKDFAPNTINLSWQSDNDNGDLRLGLDGVFYGSINSNSNINITVEHLSYNNNNSMYGESNEHLLTTGQKNAIRDLVNRCLKTNLNINVGGSQIPSDFAQAVINNR